MTVVDFDLADLRALLRQELSEEEMVGAVRALGPSFEGREANALRFDVTPNRPDLYSVEGLARALRGTLGLETGLPPYPVHESSITFRIDPSVRDVRPEAVGGLVTNVRLTEPLLASLIDLQEKLHLTLGRRRRKVAIGIHDADAVTPPFTYTAVPPTSVRFVPLGGEEAMDLATLLTDHEKGREYGPILADAARYPLILDAEERVLSFPPIINGVTTALTTETRNLFLDVTGTDAEAVHAALVIVATALAERGGQVHTVRLETPDGEGRTPDLTPREERLDLAFANGWIGLDLDAETAAELLRRMRYDATGDGDAVRVGVPAYRIDVLHAADLAEDVAIAYGFEEIPTGLPTVQTFGAATPLNRFCDALRALLIGYGYVEVLSLVLEAAETPYDPGPRALVRNPVSAEQTAVRRSLLPALLGILRINRHRELPQRVFEIGDVVVGTGNERRVAGVSVHVKAGFTEMKSLVQSLLRDVGRGGAVAPQEDANYLPGRCAAVLVGGAEVGRFGELHPRVITGYDLEYPVAAFDLAVAPLMAQP